MQVGTPRHYYNSLMLTESLQGTIHSLLRRRAFGIQNYETALLVVQRGEYRLATSFLPSHVYVLLFSRSNVISCCSMKKLILAIHCYRYS